MAQSSELVTGDVTELVPVDEQQQSAQESPQQQEQEEGWDEARLRYEGGEEQPPVSQDAAPESEPEPEPEPEQEQGVEQRQEQPQQMSASEERFRRLEAENAAMRQQIAAIMAGGVRHDPTTPQVDQQPQAQPEPQRAGAVPIPESIRSEAQEFSKRHPNLAPLVTENSSVGELVRRKLEEYGVDEAAAAALPVVEARDVLRRGQQVVENVQRQQYWSAVSVAHPDVVTAIRNGKGGLLFSELQRWAGTKPYAEGQRLMEIMRRDNDPIGTNEVLAEWKKDMGAAISNGQQRGVKAGKPTPAQRSAMAAAIGAVHSGTPSAPRTQGESLNERAQWEAAKKRWG